MPRKQRFKPSRKPQSTQGSVPSQKVDDRKEIRPEEQQEVQRQEAAITAEPDIE